jgi:POT family proton-dependent oligopeptide transporter
MDRAVLGTVIPAEWPQNLDAAFVLLLIWLFVSFVFPALERRGVRITPLRKMTVGMFVAVLSFAAAALVQAALDAGGHPHVAWQVPQYLFLSIGEVLVSVTALEFAFTQAPAQMKSAIMALWYVTISLGQLLTAVVAGLNRFRGAAFFEFFAVLMLGAAILFAVVARRYRPAESARDGAPEPA